MATTSMSVRPDSMMARSTLRPMRPKPLMATLTVISGFSLSVKGWRAGAAGNRARGNQESLASAAATTASGVMPKCLYSSL